MSRDWKVIISFCYVELVISGNNTIPIIPTVKQIHRKTTVAFEIVAKSKSFHQSNKGENLRFFNHTTRKMKIIQVVQENFSYLGISWYYSIRKYPINERNIPAFLIISTITAMDFLYLFRVANTFQEYADSVYLCALMIDVLAIFLCVSWRMRMLFDSLNQMEKFANESRLFSNINHQMKQTNDHIQLYWARMCFFYVTKYCALLIIY